jgi:hypothetical protein
LPKSIWREAGTARTQLMMLKKRFSDSNQRSQVPPFETLPFSYELEDFNNVNIEA